MKCKEDTPDQFIAKLAEGDRILDEGETVAEVARSFGVSPGSPYTSCGLPHR